MDFCKLAGDIRLYVELNRLEKLAQTSPVKFNTFKQFLLKAPETYKTQMRQNPGMINNFFTMFQSTGSLPWLSAAGQTGQSGRQMVQGLGQMRPPAATAASGLASGMAGMVGMGGSTRGNQVAAFGAQQRLQQAAQRAGVSPNAYSRLKQVTGY